MADQDRDPSNEPIPVEAADLVERSSASKLEFFGTAEQRAALFEALAEASGAFEDVVNESEGQIGHRNFRYADLAALVKATRPALSKAKISVLQLKSGPHHIIALANGSAEVHRITTIIAGRGAEIHAHIDYRRANDLKGWGQQTTYIRRYAYRTGFILDGSDDADNEPQFEQPPQRRDARPTPAQPAPARAERPAERPKAPASQPAPQAAPKAPPPVPKVEPPPSVQSAPKPASVPPPPPEQRMIPGDPAEPQWEWEPLQKELGRLFRSLGFKGRDAEALCQEVAGMKSEELDLDGGLKVLAALREKAAAVAAMH